MSNSPEYSALKGLVEAAYEDRSLIDEQGGKASQDHIQAVLDVLQKLDVGKLRVAEQVESEWITHTWVKQAVLLYFVIAKMKVMEVGPFEFFDKIPLKKNLKEQGVRVVPPGTIRYGAHVER